MKRVAVVVIAGVAFLTHVPGPVAAPPQRSLPESRLVRLSGVAAHLPERWSAHPLPDTSPLEGLEAFPALGDVRDRAVQGLEAWWVDATRIGVPSDFYYLAARGSALGPGAGCAFSRFVLADHPPDLRPTISSAADYVAASTGTCRREHDTLRFTSFVAAPGFGPVRELGIPRSGMYVVRATVRESDAAERRLARLVTSVTFGGTSVGAMAHAVGGRLYPRLAS